MKVHELMTTDVVTATADAGLKQVTRLMIAHSISGVPVLDADKHLIGIVTEADILHHEAQRAGGELLGVMHVLRGEDRAIGSTAGDAMTRHVITTGPDVDHTVAARLMETRGVKRLPVVDADGHVLGIISRSDIMASFARPDELIEDEIEVDILERILWTEPGVVKVTVDDGRVSLRGTVEKKSDARILEELTRRLDGVVAVDTRDLHYTQDDTKAGGATIGAPLGYW